MAARRTLTVLTIVVAACDVGEAGIAPAVRVPPPPPVTRDFGGGTRLRARAWEIEGALVLRAFFDRERGEACSFVEEGVWRSGPGPSYWCLPTALARHEAGVGPYDDAACTKAVALSPVDASREASGGTRRDVPRFAIVRPVDACAAPPVVHRAGGVERYRAWVKDGDACVQVAEPVPIQGLGDVIPLTSFVRAEETVVPGRGRIRALRASSADGAFQTIGGHDAVRDEAVRVQHDPVTGGMRWVPSRVFFLDGGTLLFGEATCAPGSALATKIARDALCPPTAVLSFADACGATTFREVGAAAAERWESGPSGCFPRASSHLLAATPGAPIADTALAEAVVREVASTTVRRRGHASFDGDVVAWSDVLLATTGDPCAPARATDGNERCLPVTPAAISAFADAACSVRAFVQPLTGCERPGDAPRTVREDGPDGARAWEVTAEVPSLFEKDDAGGCTPHEAPVPTRGFAVRELAPDAFPAAIAREL